MSERDHSEYDVISIRPQPGFLSLVCAVVPITFGILADDLPFLLGGRLRPFYGHLFMAGLGASVLGIVLGIMAIRRPEQRGTGRVGVPRQHGRVGAAHPLHPDLPVDPLGRPQLVLACLSCCPFWMKK